MTFHPLFFPLKRDPVVASLISVGPHHNQIPKKKKNQKKNEQACFLTRGDLFQPWTAGMRVFDRLLLDADPALNAGNWMWLSCSAFFHQYFRIYSPVSFAQKYDKHGAYVRRWIPALARMPDKYVYSPWEAPEAVQRAAGCVVGRDYPAPIVDHAVASKECMRRMGEAFAASRGEGGGGGGAGGGGSGSGSKRPGGAEAAGGGGKKKKPGRG